MPPNATVLNAESVAVTTRAEGSVEDWSSQNTGGLKAPCYGALMVIGAVRSGFKIQASEQRTD
jgi:hypothetical protein